MGPPGPSLLVTHYNQLPKVLPCPQELNRVGPSLCLLRRSLPSIFGSHWVEGQGGKMRQVALVSLRVADGCGFQELGTGSALIVWLVNSLLPSSLPSFFFPLLTSLHTLSPLFLCMTVIDTWVLGERRDLELGPINLTLAQSTPNTSISPSHLRLSHISLFGSSYIIPHWKSRIIYREETLNTTVFHVPVTDFYKFYRPRH